MCPALPNPGQRSARSRTLAARSHLAQNLLVGLLTMLYKLVVALTIAAAGAFNVPASAMSRSVMQQPRVRFSTVMMADEVEDKVRRLGHEVGECGDP